MIVPGGSIDVRVVPGPDLRVSRLILGTMTFGAQVDEREAETMIDVALDAGITMFDTAGLYTEGASEEILGRVLKLKKSDALVATKVHPNPDGLGRAAIFRAIDTSLRRLQREYVDLYYLHSPDPQTPIEESLDAMAELVRAGKVRHVGVSNYAAWQISDIRHRSAQKGWPVVTFSQQMYNLVARRLEEEYAAFSDSAQLFDVVYNPLAGGLLTAKHGLGSTPLPGSRFSQEMYRRRYWNEQQFRAVERLSEAARAEGLSLIELALRWLLSRQLVDAVLIGASTVEQLRSNLAAAAGPTLPDGLLQLCDDVWRDLRGVAPGYNR
jgi:aryl-alcohol dehydrogenase-like predicted oxidoreductase